MKLQERGKDKWLTLAAKAVPLAHASALLTNRRYNFY